VDYDREERAEGRRPVLLWTFGGDDGGRSRKGKRSAEDVEDAEESPSRDGLLEERRRTIVKSLRLRGYSGPIHVGRGRNTREDAEDFRCTAGELAGENIRRGLRACHGCRFEAECKADPTRYLGAWRRIAEELRRGGGLRVHQATLPTALHRAGLGGRAAVRIVLDDCELRDAVTPDRSFDAELVERAIHATRPAFERAGREPEAFAAAVALADEPAPSRKRHRKR